MAYSGSGVRIPVGPPRWGPLAQWLERTAHNREVSGFESQEAHHLMCQVFSQENSTPVYVQLVERRS